MVSYSMNNPVWWNEEKHGSAWMRVKDALRRDWEQTKSDLTRGRKGVDTDQNVKDTVRQAVGKDATTSKDDWTRVEPGYRYGYGASTQYSDKEWNPGIEGKLRQEWDDLKSGRTWDEMKDHIRRGWDAARNRPRTI